MEFLMKQLVLILSVLFSFTVNAATYDCDALLGLSQYDSNAVRAKIQNFQVTNLGALAGDVVIGQYQFSFYQYNQNGGNISLMIAEVQVPNPVTPYLAKAVASVVAPTKGQEVSVTLSGFGSLTCKAL
jgi:hypothetical protein